MTDYTIASKIVPPAFDPLKTIAAANTVQQGLLQNKLLGQNVQQTLAQRAAAQASIDPATGNSDPDLYSAALAKGGASPEALLQAQQQRQLQLQTKISQLGLTKDQMALSAQELQNGAQVAQGVLANGTQDPSALSKESISAAIENNLIQPGLIKSPEGIAHAKALEGMMTDDPQQNAQLLQQFVNQSTDIVHALGAPTAVSTGGGTTFASVNPATKEVTVQGNIPNTLPPTAKATRVSTVNPANNQPTTVPLSATVDDLGNALKPGAPGAAPNLGPGGSLPAQPPLGAEATASAGGAGRANQGVAFEASLAKAANGWAAQHSSLSQFGNLVDQIASGNKAGSIKKLGQFAAEFNLPVPASTKNDTAGLEEAGKLSQLIAQQQFQQLGGTGTDAKLESAMHTSPSEFLSRVGNKRILPLLQGLNDAAKAQADLYQTWKAQHGPEDYADFINQWNQHFDPRAFQSAYMTPADVASMRASMGKDERANFDSFRAFAKQKGWLGGQ